MSELREVVARLVMEIAGDRGGHWNVALGTADAILALPALSGCGVAPDVVRLVHAARKVAFEDYEDSDIRELDAASEAFASRVPWDDEPEADE